MLELLVVLIILALVIGIAGPAVLRQFARAKTDTARIEVNRLVTNLEFYRVDVGRFPSKEEGMQALLNRPGSEARWNGPYLQKASQLNDPWGRPYLYEISENGQLVTVSSLGADGTKGGEGENLDISSQE